jgi:hypothetical protein
MRRFALILATFGRNFPRGEHFVDYFAYITAPIMRDTIERMIMFNRQIQIGWVKKSNKNDKSFDQEDTTINDQITVTGVTIEGIVKKVAMACLSYVILDTARQVIIEKSRTYKI